MNDSATKSRFAPRMKKPERLEQLKKFCAESPRSVKELTTLMDCSHRLVRIYIDELPGLQFSDGDTPAIGRAPKLYFWPTGDQ